MLVKNAMDSAVSCLVFAIATGPGLWESSLVMEEGRTMRHGSPFGPSNLHTTTKYLKETYISNYNIYYCIINCILYTLHTLSVSILRYPYLLYHWAFCATCVTICSGSMAERTHIVGYLTHSALMAGVIFPPLAEAVWGTRGLVAREELSGARLSKALFRRFRARGA